MRHEIHIDKLGLAKALLQQAFENLLVIVVAIVVVIVWSKFLNG